MGEYPANQLYGLRVNSPWPLSGPTQRSEDTPDVELFEGAPSAFAQAPPQPLGPNPWFHRSHLDDGSTYLHWTDQYDFMVSADGRRVAYRSLARASEESLRTYLLPQVLSFSLLKQGWEPLHATTVAVEGGAIAFLGDCGYGKSTLAAEFLRAGCPLLTDDVLVLKRSGNNFLAFPGPARLKLFPHVAKEVLGEQAKGTPMNHMTPKMILALDPGQVQDSPVPLRGVYVIAPERKDCPRSRISIRPISQKNATLELLRNTFNCMVVEPERLERQLQHAAQVAATVPMRRLSYPRRLESLPTLRERILADLARLGR